MFASFSGVGKVMENKGLREIGDQEVCSLRVMFRNGKAIKNEDGSYSNKNTIFLDVEGWAGRGAILSKYKKGDLIYIDGQLSQRTWEREDGTKVDFFSVKVDRSYAADYAGDTGFSKPAAPSKKSKPKQETFTDDDDGDDEEVPF